MTLFNNISLGAEGGGSSRSRSRSPAERGDGEAGSRAAAAGRRHGDARGRVHRAQVRR